MGKLWHPMLWHDSLLCYDDGKIGRLTIVGRNGRE